MPMSTSQPYTTPPPLNYDGWIRFIFFVQPKFMKRLDRPHKRRSLCAWKGTKKSSREVGLFLSLSVHNSDATFLHWGHQPPLVVPLYSWLHVSCATFWCISGFSGPLSPALAVALNNATLSTIHILEQYMPFRVAFGSPIALSPPCELLAQFVILVEWCPLFLSRNRSNHPVG